MNQYPNWLENHKNKDAIKQLMDERFLIIQDFSDDRIDKKTAQMEVLSITEKISILAEVAI
ncbi:hypothetical protein LJC10_03090 [Selenomonadales bacterium OttesenSCG-928-I06]|nr:hypothetical protein [Selenomonadales bacterium OttesenSCG-928-I06]